MSDPSDTAPVAPEAPTEVPPDPAAPPVANGVAAVVASVQAAMQAAVAEHERVSASAVAAAITEFSSPLREAQAAHEKATTALKDMHAEVQRVNDERDKEVAKLAELDALDELTIEQVRDKLNGEKRVRRLDAQLAMALEAVTAESEKVDRADSAVKAAEVLEGDLTLRVWDREFIQFAIEFANAAAEKLERMFGLKRRIDLLEVDSASPEVVAPIFGARGTHTLTIAEARPVNFNAQAVEHVLKLLSNLDAYARHTAQEEEMERSRTSHGFHIDRGTKKPPQRPESAVTATRPEVR